MINQSAQVVVVGAGPAGTATAGALAAGGVDVLLVDKASFPREKICGDGLTPRSVAVLDRMGLLPPLESAGALRIPGARLFAPNGRFIEVLFAALENAPFPYGLTTPRKTLDALLLDHARRAGARFLSPLRVTGLLRQEGTVVGVRGTLADEVVTVQAGVTCLATGAAMPLVREAGLLPTKPPVIRATRGYFENLRSQEPLFQFHFDRDLLPGYGWLFPLAGDKANVGIAIYRTRRPDSPYRRYERFVRENPRMRDQLGQANPVAKAKSHPLRIDFPAMRTETDGLLLVGEAAGLVNPINGEGVDYALESGLLAARAISEALAAGDLSGRRLAAYGRQLQERYLDLYRYLTRMRRWYLREPVLNLIVRKAQRRPHLKNLLINAALGMTDARNAFSLCTLKEILL
jgi:geranylgeranyl reductase family protein